MQGYLSCMWGGKRNEAGYKEIQLQMGWAGVAMQKPLAIQKVYGGTDRQMDQQMEQRMDQLTNMARYGCVSG